MNPLHQYNVNSLYSRGKPSQDSFLDDWETVKKKIVNVYGEVVFRSWFKSVVFSCHDSGTIFLIAPSRFIRDWIRTNYLDFILKVWRDIDKKIITIDLIVLNNNLKPNSNSSDITKDNNVINISASEERRTSDNRVNSDVAFEEKPREEKFFVETLVKENQDEVKQFDLFGDLSDLNKPSANSESEKKNTQSMRAENKIKREERVRGDDHGILYTADSLDLLIKPSFELTKDEIEDRQICFDRRYTFENFVQGESNELAYFACRSLAENKKMNGFNNNPLFLYGGVGLGKTHLMHAIANHKIQGFKEKYRENWIQKVQEKIVYLPSEKFMNDFLYALKTRCTKDFKARFKSVDVLMIDDVQFFMGKGCTQEEFFHILNNLMNDGKQLIISADRLPGLLTGLDEKIRSRLGWGLVADIRPGGYELRLGVLRRKSQYLGIQFEDNVLKYLAENIDNNIRELEGALNKLVVIKQLSPSKIIDICLVRERLSDMLRKDIDHNVPNKLSNNRLIDSISLNSSRNSSNPKMICSNQNNDYDSERNERRDDARIGQYKNSQITILAIQEKVSHYYDISIDDILSDVRARNLSLPRQVAMYLTKKLTSLSLMEIAKQFGGKNHSTIIHGISKIESTIKNNLALSGDIDNIVKSLKLN